jgi:hypothetical protein
MEVKKIKLKGDPYVSYVKIISILFNLTPLEERVTVALLKKYESLLLEASPKIANEVLFSTRITKEIKNELELKEATFNNVKSSLSNKGVIIENTLNPRLKLTEIHFVYEDNVQSL